MNNAQLFLIVLIVTVSFCTGLLVLAAKFLQRDEEKFGNESCSCATDAHGMDLDRHLPAQADQRSGSLARRCTLSARTARNGRRESNDKTNRVLPSYLS